MMSRGEIASFTENKNKNKNKPNAIIIEQSLVTSSL